MNMLRRNASQVGVDGQMLHGRKEKVERIGLRAVTDRVASTSVCQRLSDVHTIEAGLARGCFHLPGEYSKQ